MHILVLGAGVVGTTTAWYLQKQGHQVTVVDRQNQAGLETSYANGGQISVSHAEPWANPSAPLKVMKWLFQPDAPLLFRPRLDPAQWRWALSFLGQCTSARAAHNIRQMVNLGTYSRSQLQALRNEAGIEYNHLEKGILHFYTNPAEFDGAMEPTRIMQDLGCDRQIIDADRAVELEPALKPIRNRIAGATYTSEDESGDARMFTQNLAKRCAEAGVEFRYGTEILGFERAGERVLGIQTLRDGHHETLRADAYVLSMGSFSAALASQLGIFLNIYPAKGYSITVPVKNEEAAFNVSLTDDEYKLVYSRLGDRMRVGGHGRTERLQPETELYPLPRYRAPHSGSHARSRLLGSGGVLDRLTACDAFQRAVHRKKPLRQPLPEYRTRHPWMDPFLWFRRGPCGHY